ncbi:uncharacterized protein RHOBADRAFT_53061 [Rhodotorula graminis WP1]|uniref:Uncharacterized protein n=1 Tax=Rhodotorula graminis (strain WP1) TaxID=578459 RepID=A0A194S654_RHOGW|nr:uncharacterized protein RHOBADRAFT_53061 [Rhodotorula graminis WP1]KPV76067.1 hypothetical protein RHOBADRAFT_53061 [Rhodotorula graminis WP1]
MSPLQSPEPAPAPADDQLPALGQRFSSVSSFKLQTYRALGASPSTFGGSSKRALVRCRLTTLSTEYALNQKGANCTWLVSANNRGCDGELEVAVDRVCLVHTCPETCRPAYAVEDLPDLERKISKMEDRVRADEENARPVARAADEPAAASAAPSSSTATGAARTAPAPAPRRGGGRKLRRKAPVNYKVADRLDLGELLADGPSKELYPPANKLKDQISQINGIVRKPARGQTFTSSSVLFATMHAYAQQNNFHVYRGTQANNLDRVSIVCRRWHPRFEDSRPGRCPVQFDAERDDDDSWRLVNVKLEHTHDLDGARAASTADSVPASQGPSKRARHEAPSPQPRQKPLAAPDPSTPVSRDTSALADKPHAHPTPPWTGAAPHGPAPPRASSSSSSAPSPAPSADLLAFLSALYSPAVAADRSSALARAGISTAKHVALLLDLEPSVLQVADDEMRLRDGDFGRTWSLVDVQQAMREAYGAK